MTPPKQEAMQDKILAFTAKVFPGLSLGASLVLGLMVGDMRGEVATKADLDAALVPVNLRLEFIERRLDRFDEVPAKIAVLEAKLEDRGPR